MNFILKRLYDYIIIYIFTNSFQGFLAFPLKPSVILSIVKFVYLQIGADNVVFSIKRSSKILFE